MIEGFLYVIGIAVVLLLWQTASMNNKLEKCVSLLGECVSALDDINGKTPEEETD